jgi:hypothetical protein
MSNLKKCFIMGLPNAGKTTYLAALWYCLNSAVNKNKLKLNAMGNTKYLADLSKKWLNAKQLDRTKLGYENTNISIEIIDENKDIFNLKFPDLSGETFQNQYEKREISIELVEYITSADGIMLFINVSDIKGITYISEIPDDYRQDNNDPNIIRNPRQDDPIQVQVIELLQFVNFLKNNQVTNLGIILSAWDLVKDIGIELTPEDYIKKEMNMLWQFLKSNSELFSTMYWGVSAQGGVLDNDKLLDFLEPMDRIIVVDNNGEICHDITLPIFKLVGGFNA